MNSGMLNLALHYLTRGWSLIPIKAGTKNQPCCKWKRFQTEAADELQLRKWFGNGRASNVAIVLGAVSGGLVCRDFDTMEAYDRWAADHPDLAPLLPTVATSRGRQVYFRAAPADLFFVDLRMIDPPEDGEYRGDSGHYCLLPPSQHPDGPIYRWLVPLPDGEIPFVADVRAAGLLPSHVTESTEGTETTESTEDNGGVQRQLEECVCEKPPHTSNCSVLSVLSVTSDEKDDEIDRAILETIPSGIGRRNRQVFELPRALKAIPRLADAPVDAMKPHVRRWHRIGLEKAVIGTEPFDEAWIDFLHAWPKVKFPRGKEPMIAILERAKHSPPPAVAQNYEGDGLRLLIAICRELQCASGNKPFYLACRTAATLLDLGENGHVKAWRWLTLLVHDGVIEAVKRGERGKRRASRFRYSENE
jgi:hypothetical protein